MDGTRFKELRNLVGYDNGRLAAMLTIELPDVLHYCRGSKPVPAHIACYLELFADWAREVGDIAVKKELAKKHLGDSSRTTND